MIESYDIHVCVCKINVCMCVRTCACVCVCALRFKYNIILYVTNYEKWYGLLNLKLSIGSTEGMYLVV